MAIAHDALLSLHIAGSRYEAPVKREHAMTSGHARQPSASRYKRGLVNLDFTTSTKKTDCPEDSHPKQQHVDTSGDVPKSLAPVTGKDKLFVAVPGN